MSQASPGSPPAAPVTTRGRVLVVDDEVPLLRGYVRTLTAAGYTVESASDGVQAAEMIKRLEFDVVVSDISMPGMDGLELLRAVRETDLDVPVVLVTGDPAVETAMKALEFGALRYLVKPLEAHALEDVVQHAVRLNRMAGMKRQAQELLGATGKQIGDRAGLEAAFGRALKQLWIAYQPIVCWSERRVFGYEALVRSTEPKLPHPGALFDAAERLDRLQDLGRAIRDSAVPPVVSAPDCGALFVNLHTRDLLDDTLFAPASALAAIAHRVVLEITERASLDEVKDVRTRIGRLREMGFRIAIDDLGAGYAGLTAFAQLEPEVVKLDMSLVRDVHREPTKRKLIKSMSSLARDMGMLVVAEGIENAEERDTLVDLGCDLLQGFFFARPGKPFPEATL